MYFLVIHSHEKCFKLLNATDYNQVERKKN